MQRWQRNVKIKRQKLTGWIVEVDIGFLFPRTHYYFFIGNEANSASRAFDDISRIIVVDRFVRGVTQMCMVTKMVELFRTHVALFFIYFRVLFYLWRFSRGYLLRHLVFLLKLLLNMFYINFIHLFVYIYTH